MNKVVNINLNGLIITIDETAYGKLKSYIDGLHAHFAGTEGSAEIISDIETRIAELLQLKLTASYTVIQEQDVEEVIAMMGNPSQMDAPDEESAGWHHAEDKRDGSKQGQPKKLRRDGHNKVLAGVCSGISNFLNIDPVFIRGLFLVALFVFGTGVLLYLILWIAMPEAGPGDLPGFSNTRQKRLFRNEDNKMLGGVCAGAADYFGIDAVWLRLLFLAALFFYGTGILLYIALWLIIPKAVTAAQKLQMKGEPVDVNNIERVIRNTFSRAEQPATGLIAGIVSAFGQLFGLLLKAAGKLAAIFLGFVALVITGMAVFFLFYEQEQFRALVSAFTINSEVLNFIRLAVGCFAVSFTLGLLLLAYRLFSGKSPGLRYAGLVNTVLFIAGFVLLAIAGVKYVSLINTQQEVIERRMVYPTADTLYFEMAPRAAGDKAPAVGSLKTKRYRKGYRRKYRSSGISIVFRDGSSQPLVCSQTLRIQASLTDSIEVKIRRQARGPGVAEAGKIAAAVQYSIRTDSSRFVFDRGIPVGGEYGYRYQAADITLSIPVGTVIVMRPGVADMMRHAEYDMRTGTLYKVTQDGLACMDCDGGLIIDDGVPEEDGDWDVEIDLDADGHREEAGKRHHRNKRVIVREAGHGRVVVRIPEDVRVTGPGRAKQQGE